MKKDLRILVTQSCDFDCFFCHHEGISTNINEELTIDDYVILYELYSDIEKWNGVTISGGEPLLYRQINELCKNLYNKGARITLVTNGHFLLEKIDTLKYIHQINVSIHSLDENIYSKITGRKNILSKVLSNLQVVRNIYPNLDIRINVTPTIDTWSIDTLKEFLNFAKKINASIKFTELFPQTSPKCISIDTISNSLSQLGYVRTFEDGRTKAYCLANNPDVYIMQCTCSQAKAHSKPISFCRETHDLYLTANGKLSLCRLDNSNIDILEDVKEKNLDILTMKLRISLHRISNQQCERNLILNNV